MFSSLIYVSRSVIPPAEHDVEMEAIVSGSIKRNAGLEVRGALIFTEQHFAQLLEGPEPAIDELMKSIERDRRHTHVTVIDRRPIDGYRFPDWALAYWGSASYMDEKIAAVLRKVDQLTRNGQTAQLYELIQLLAKESHSQQGPLGRPSPR